MKTRNGFVSNSSSTCYIITTHKLKRIAKKLTAAQKRAEHRKFLQEEREFEERIKMWEAWDMADYEAMAEREKEDVNEK